MKLKSILSVLALVVLVSSCRRENETFSVNVLREWFVPFSASYSSPATAGRTDSGTVHIILYEDSSLRYDYRITNLKSGDAMTGVTLNAGNPVTNGPVLLDLKPRIGSNYVTGGAFHLSSTLMDSLLNNAPIYFNVTSTQNTAGLLRGQLNSTIIFAGNVALTGSQAVPPVTTTATGLAEIRITSDKTLYSKVTLSNMAPDQPTKAQLYAGTAGQPATNLIVTLANNAADFNVPKVITLTDAQYDSIMALPAFINVTSQLFPNGKLRGQLK